MKKIDWKTLSILALLLVIASVVMYWNSDDCGTCLVEPESGNDSFFDVSVSEASSMIKNRIGDSDFSLMDIRTETEFVTEHIEGAINLDYYAESFRDDLDKLDKGKTYLIYCRTARRTGETMPVMQDLGFLEVYNMAGGINSWKTEGFATVE